MMQETNFKALARTLQMSDKLCTDLYTSQVRIIQPEITATGQNMVDGRGGGQRFRRCYSFKQELRDCYLED